MQLKKIIFFIFSLVLTSCKKESTFGDYSVYTRDKGEVVIIDNKRKSRTEVINPDIERMAILDNLVIGKAVKIKEVDGYITPGGYFLLNIETKQIKEGMNLRELKELLAKKYQISELPKLEAL